MSPRVDEPGVADACSVVGVVVDRSASISALGVGVGVARPLCRLSVCVLQPVPPTDSTVNILPISRRRENFAPGEVACLLLRPIPIRFLSRPVNLGRVTGAIVESLPQPTQIAIRATVQEFGSS